VCRPKSHYRQRQLLSAAAGPVTCKVAINRARSKNWLPVLLESRFGHRDYVLSKRSRSCDEARSSKQMLEPARLLRLKPDRKKSEKPGLKHAQASVTMSCSTKRSSHAAVLTKGRARNVADLALVRQLHEEHLWAIEQTLGMHHSHQYSRKLVCNMRTQKSCLVAEHVMRTLRLTVRKQNQTRASELHCRMNCVTHLDRCSILCKTPIEVWKFSVRHQQDTQQRLHNT